MQGADETFVREMADEVQHAPGPLSRRDRRSTLQLLYVVSAAILGSEAARRIFHVESIIQDPNVQELIREWEDKGHTEGLAEGRARQARSMLICVLAARSLPISRAVRSRIDREADLGQLEAWITAASTATTVAQVFENG